MSRIHFGSSVAVALVFTAAVPLASADDAPVAPPAPVESAELPKPAEPPKPPTEPLPPAGPGTTSSIDKAPMASSAHLVFTEGGAFQLRNGDDSFVLQPSGRLQIDGYGYAGKGVTEYQNPAAYGAAQNAGAGTGLKANLGVRRLMLELGGSIGSHWFFWLGGSFGPQTVDGYQRAQSSAAVYNAYVGYEADPMFRVQIGQFNAPFTMENMTSSRFMDFMERSLTVRTVGAPYNLDLGIMAWGSSRSLDWYAGVFGGDGANRPSVDNRVDGMARVVFRPLANREDALGHAHVGASVRYGRRDPDLVFYDAPAMTASGGYAYYQPVYGKGVTETHIIPANQQLAAAAELYLPFDRFDLRGELVWVNEGRREAFVTTPWQSERYGSLKGIAAYAQLSVWPLGTPRINGHPGTPPARVKAAAPPSGPAPQGLQLVFRGELVRLTYDSNAGDREVAPGSTDLDTRADASPGASARSPNIVVQALQFAANLWATKHVRVSAQYSLYVFPGSPISTISRVAEFPASPKPDNMAVAPGARANAFDFSATSFHEFGLRVGLSL